ncbi:MAG TPA: hypothetical protein PLI09_02230 [Candidatus Hydrogenedentes bacterium]|nr:hypothetical protein [Candidatus Hydrogenedentota bacterium]
MNYDEATKARFHRAGRENNVEPALAPMSDFMRQHVDRMYRDNRSNPAIMDLNICFETMRRPDVLSETGLIIWNIWNNSQKGRGEPVLWDYGNVVLSIACCAYVDPAQIKTVYPENYEVWINDLLDNIPPDKAIIDVMFGLEGQRMAVHMSFIAPQKQGATKRGFCILATDLVSRPRRS